MVIFFHPVGEEKLGYLVSQITTSFQIDRGCGTIRGITRSRCNGIVGIGKRAFR
ncbi:MAG: hypothetical protein F6K10_38215 [Moorea sp. SIO2B7]|nr:hypothetical protein [Moorena sp. SIO2B7]